MKKTISVYFAIILASTSINPDVLEVGYHNVSREVVVSNAGSYPDIVLIGYVKSATATQDDVYQITDNVPINKGYKFNTFRLFIASKTYVDNAGGINNIDFSQFENTMSNQDFLEPGDYSVPDANPLISETVTYSIVSRTSTDVTLKITKRIRRFNNGAPDKEEIY